MVKQLLVIAACVTILSGCASRSDTLYEELGKIDIVRMVL